MQLQWEGVEVFGTRIDQTPPQNCSGGMVCYCHSWHTQSVPALAQSLIVFRYFYSFTMQLQFLALAAAAATGVFLPGVSRSLGEEIDLNALREIAPDFHLGFKVIPLPHFYTEKPLLRTPLFCTKLHAPIKHGYSLV